jgi:hypothetical protein
MSSQVYPSRSSAVGDDLLGQLESIRNASNVLDKFTSFEDLGLL